MRQTIEERQAARAEKTAALEAAAVAARKAATPEPEAFAQLVQHSGTVAKSIKVPPVWESIAARCKAFSAAILKYAPTAQPGRAPFLAYQKASDGSIYFTGETAQRDAANVMKCTAKFLRASKIEQKIALRAEQLPDGWAVRVYRTGSKSRFMAATPTSF